MKLRLILSSDAHCEVGDIVNLVNGLQMLFTAFGDDHRLVLPVDARTALPLRFDEVREFLKEKDILTGSGLVLVTSRLIQNGRPREFVLDERLAVISNHKRADGPAANTIWVARQVIHAGVSFILGAPCKERACIRSDQEQFLALCDACESRLRELGYRDGVNDLKNGMNWLNQRYEAKVPDMTLRSNWRPEARLWLAERYASLEHTAGGDPFKGKMILMVLHFLSDLLPFVRALATMGASFSDMFLVAKPYPYARRDWVSHQLEALGVNVFRATKIKDVTNVATAVLEDLQSEGKARGRKLLVIEDGGYFGPLLHEGRFSNLLDECVGIVEQTTKGARRDANIPGGTKVPILSVARSTFKDEYESPEIGRITVQNIGRFVPNTKLSGGHAIVFGFGSVGEHVAANLNRAFNMGVSVVDVGDAAILRAIHRKDIVFEAKKRFEDLTIAKATAVLVVGTSGETAISPEVITALPPGCIVASTSSDRGEIDMEWLTRECLEKRDIEEGNTVFTLSAGGGKKELTVLAEGYPINFYASESLPNDTIDPIMTLLILCGIEASRRADLKAAIHEEIVDELTHTKGLIALCLERSQSRYGAGIAPAQLVR